MDSFVLVVVIVALCLGLATRLSYQTLFYFRNMGRNRARLGTSRARIEEESKTDNGTGMRIFVIQDSDKYHVALNEAVRSTNLPTTLTSSIQLSLTAGTHILGIGTAPFLLVTALSLFWR